MKKVLAILIVVGLLLFIIASFWPEKAWVKKLLSFWREMGDWFANNIWSKVKEWLKIEVEPRAKEEIQKRKPTIQEEFQKEKEEIKEDAPKVTKSFREYWEKLKTLIQ